MPKRGAILCGGLVAWLILSGAVPASSPAPTSPKPAAPKPGAIDDRWLSVIALDELSQAAAGNPGAPGPAKAEVFNTAILERLRCGGFEDLAALNDLVYASRACRYLPAAGKLPGGERFAAWLAQNRGVSRLMFRALGDVKDPPESLRKLQELVAAEERSVLAYPDLAVAFATALPVKYDHPQPQAASMLDGFRWYTDPNQKFRYDLRKLPYEVLRYLADTRLSLTERRWAMGEYGRMSDPAQSYFQVPYDMDHLMQGKTKKIDSGPYTLPNLKRLGGVCVDEAYFAAEVCKAIGVPASVIFGRGGSGVPHSWPAFLRLSGKQAQWDAQTARYAEHHYFFGAVRDPASGEDIYDSVLALYGEAAQLPLQQREEADAAVALARLVDSALELQDAKTRPAVQPAMPTLRRLAADYEKRWASSAPSRPGASPKADTSWLTVRRTLGRDLVEELLMLAIQRNLAHAPAWDFLVELRRKDRIPVDHLNRFFDVLMTKTSIRYPEFLYLTVMRTVPTLPDPGHREKVYRRVLDIYKPSEGRSPTHRPDLHGRILIAMGDDFRQQGRKPEALQTYRTAATISVQVAEVVVKAAQRAEGMLNDSNRPDMAIEMYQQLFDKVRKDDQAGIFKTQTSHYQIGQRLAELLKSAGQADAARKVMTAIES